MKKTKEEISRESGHDGEASVTVSMGKLTEGIGTVFAGVLTMLESLDTGTAKTLVERFAQGTGKQDRAPAEKPEAEEPASASDTMAKKATQQEAPEVKDTPVAESAAPADVKRGAGKSESAPSGVTADDITRIVVQKVKQNPGMNDRIRALVNAHGAQRVSELPESEYEAFLTDLVQL